MELFNGIENVEIDIRREDTLSGVLSEMGKATAILACKHDYISESDLRYNNVRLIGHNIDETGRIASWGTFRMLVDIGLPDTKSYRFANIDYITFNYQRCCGGSSNREIPRSSGSSDLKEHRIPYPYSGSADQYQEHTAEEITVFANASKDEPQRTVTLCGKYRDNKNSDEITVRVGWAVCHPLDEFDWSLAKEISSNRVRSRNPVGSFTLPRRGRSDKELRDDIHAMLEKHAEFELESENLWTT